MPNVSSLYRNERTTRLTTFDDFLAPPDEFTFDLRVDTEIRRVSGADIFTLVLEARNLNASTLANLQFTYRCA